MKPQITIITLGVTDLVLSTKFYKETLQFSLGSSSNKDISFFELENITFALYPLEKLAEDAQVPMEMPKHSTMTLAHNLPSKEAVDELFAQLEEKEVTIIKQPQDVFWGGYSGYFTDPDGYLWEVAFNPHRT